MVVWRSFQAARPSSALCGRFVSGGAGGHGDLDVNAYLAVAFSSLGAIAPPVSRSGGRSMSAMGFIPLLRTALAGEESM
jgi:hypothetical protein